MTRSLAERLHERLESQTAEIAALTESELSRLSQRVTESVSTELTCIENAIVRSTRRISNELPLLYWIVGMTWAALIVSLLLTGYLLWHSPPPTWSSAGTPLETFQSRGQTLMILPDEAKPVQCTTPSGQTAICLQLTSGE